MKMATNSKNELKAVRQAAEQAIHEALHPDKISTSKDGTLTCRWVYCFFNGVDDGDYAGKVMDLLMARGIAHEITDHGDAWNSYHRNASVAQQPHFYVEVRIAA